MAGKPPLHPELPTGATLNLPEKVRKLGTEAFESSIGEDREKAQKLEDKYLAAVREVQNQGIAVAYTPSNVQRPLPGKGGRKTRRNTTSGGDIVSHLLTIRNQIKLYHWQTNRFARHKATDDLTAALDLNIDAFVESYMGRYGRPKVSGSIKLHNFTESAAKAFVERETKYLEKELPKKIGKGDSDLLNLRDTILGDLTKVSYLFTLQ
jgi:hypothetical protein